MIVIRTMDGHEIDGDENAVELIAGPYPHDVGSHTYVYGLTQTVLVTAERPEALVARLGVKPPLAKLTRPDRSPVWVKGTAVTSVRAPIPAEEQGMHHVFANKKAVEGYASGEFRDGAVIVYDRCRMLGAEPDGMPLCSPE